MLSSNSTISPKFSKFLNSPNSYILQIPQLYKFSLLLPLPPNIPEERAVHCGSGHKEQSWYTRWCLCFLPPGVSGSAETWLDPHAPMQNGGSTCEPPPSRITPGSSISQQALPERGNGPPSPGHPDLAINRAPRAPHTWTQCPGAAFHVRQGPNYAVTGKKACSSVESRAGLGGLSG